MELKLLKWLLLGGTSMRRVVLRALMFMMALIVVSLLQMAHDVRIIEPRMSNVDRCSSDMGLKHEYNLNGSFHFGMKYQFPLFGSYKLSNKESQSLTTAVFKELAEKNLLQSHNAKSLCVGEGSVYATSALRQLGFSKTVAIEKHPFFSILKRKFVYELEFEDNDFDFVFSGDIGRVLVPALLVSELERVLSPGGTGVIIVGARKYSTGGLIRSQIPVVSFLKSSDVVHACGVGSVTLLMFKKRLETYASFEHFQLPVRCPSVTNSKQFMKYIEPLSDHSLQSYELSYLPRFMNISSRNKLIYMNVGAGEFAKTSIAKISKAYNLNHRLSFEAFIIDHKTSVLASFLSDPGFNFVYYPTFSGVTYAPEISSDEHLSAPMEEASFNLSRWFRETVSDGDFTVLMMNAKSEELDILVELFITGAICHVDELFLLCPDCQKNTDKKCLNILKSLRKSGVYAHQWSGD